MTKHEKQILNIANKELFYWMSEGRKDLETHRSDDEDFMDLAIWDIKRALEATSSEEPTGKGQRNNIVKTGQSQAALFLV